MSHTPAPWNAEIAQMGEFSIEKNNASTHSGLLVIASRGPHATRAEEMEANARLIAAAPDLKLALERAQGCIRGLIRQTPVRDVGETLAEIEHALAKAEGK